MPATATLQLALHVIAQLQQVARVLRGVLEHVRRQWPHRPIRSLVFFVQPDVEVLLQQRRKTERLDAEQLRRNTRVENFGDVPAVILMQQPQVVIGVVKNYLDTIALKQLAQFRRRSDRKWIDDRASLARGNLEQVDAIEKAMEAGTLGVERELRNICYLIQKAIYLGRLVEVLRALRIRWRHHSNLVR